MSNNNNTNGFPPNRVRFVGFNWASCGYCRGERRSVDRPADACSRSFGVIASNHHISSSSSMTNCYETFLCNGWRRSGRLLYKPDNDVSCCPQHTIRLGVNEFAPNKKQRKLQKSLNSLLNPLPIQNQQQQQQQSSSAPKLTKQQRNERIQAWLQSSGTLKELQDATAMAIQLHCSTPNDESNSQEPQLPPIRYKVHRYENNVLTLGCSLCTQLGLDAADIVPHLVGSTHRTWSSNTANVLVVQQQPVSSTVLFASSGSSPSTSTTSNRVQKWWKNTVGGAPTNGPCRLSVTTLPATESAARFPKVHQLFWDYQTAIHGDEHPLRMNSSGSNSSDDNDDDSQVEEEEEEEELELNPLAAAMLQQTYGNGDTSAAAITAGFAKFWDFLVDSPLDTTVHQQYWINDTQLVAVSVLDILPTGVSSVYCFYDPVFSKECLPLGSLAILYEIAYTRHVLQKPYYYLGYYIASCPKMSYKADYGPCQVRCPVTGEWRLLAETKDLDRRHGDDDDNNSSRVNCGASHPPPVAADAVLLGVGNGAVARLSQFKDPEDTAKIRPHVEDWILQAGCSSLVMQCVLDLV